MWDIILKWTFRNYIRVYIGFMWLIIEFVGDHSKYLLSMKILNF